MHSLIFPLNHLNKASRRSCQDMPSILDWPLPQPAYDEVTAELEDQSEDQEVRSIYRALTETEESVATAGAVAACRNESQSADLFQELQREVENYVCAFLFQCLSSNTVFFRTPLKLLHIDVFHLIHPSQFKYCLHCPMTVSGDGEAAGSYGNRPLPPFLSSPHDSGSSGTPSTDLPASAVSFFHLWLLCQRLF